ncbi:hypothetical protein QUC31_000570 [Theobroma cacao]
MPHRTTYFFPRQFPDRGFDASSKQLLDHENKVAKEATSTTAGAATTTPTAASPFNPVTENDRNKSISRTALKDFAAPAAKTNNSPLSDLFTDDKLHSKKQQLAAFRDWFVERKATTDRSRHVKPSSRRLSSTTDEDRELLLPPEPAPPPSPPPRLPLAPETTIVINDRSVDRNFDRQLSLPRFSSGSSYAGSLFSGTTLDGNLSSEVKDTWTKDTSSSLPVPATREVVEPEPEAEESKDSLALKSRDSYYFQLMLARRLTSQASLLSEPLLLQEYCGANVVDAETVSYRLWVSGCLSYNDKISDGFYNILGMNPYLWVMCNEFEEGRRLPPLMSLREIEPNATSMEVVLVDRRGDTRLKELEDKAQELYCASENTLVLVEKLGQLVAIYMGGTFPVEQGDLHERWKMVSRRLKDLQKCIVFPIGSLSTGLCRHRAILFKKLADYIGLPCRIARGCKYCAADHRSSCLVKIEDDRQPSREYVVDLVGEPGNIHGPDSSINGGFLSSMPSPFQISHLKEFQQPYMDNASYCQIEDSKNSCSPFENPLHSGGIEKCQKLKDNGLLGNQKVSQYAPIDQDHLGKESSLMPFETAAVATMHENIEQNLRKELFVSGSSVVKGVNQLKVNLPSQSDLEEIGAELDNRGRFAAVTIPRYLNLEPSLAMDWLEISWDELHIKERVGAGSFGTVHRAEWHGSQINNCVPKQDVAVKVLTVQDFQDDQLKEFLREVAIMKRVRHPNVVLFMGAVTKRPHLSIVTEYLPRGSLYRLIHRPAAGETLDQRRRLRMALDVAKGINYLHCLNPPIVHWDLKSPNLLVDKNWTVKVCDFGLSRFKADTFISSKSVAGTPEWMAPEFLRGEPSNEKSDVYSFGVILWELATMQQPWSGLSPAQVVGAVAFQNRRLAIPPNTSPKLASLMESCWADDPAQRPSFGNIVEGLKKLLKSPLQLMQMGSQ